MKKSCECAACRAGVAFDPESMRRFLSSRGLTPKNPRHLREIVRHVEKHVGPSGFLVGDRFSVADLAAAALLAPGVDVRHPDMLKPEQKPAAVEEWMARWADHPGAAWVRETYEHHCPGRAPEA